jgi:Protein of unknown function (DUF1569)
MAGRRDLSFARLDEVMPDVERLLAGHVTVGQWTLGQICNHLATAFNFLMDGRSDLVPFTSTEEDRSSILRKRFFRGRRFPEGAIAPFRALIPSAGLDDREEADALREAIARFSVATGPFPAHPFIGPLTKDEWVRFHCLHAAHHLGFAVPREGESSG